MTNSINNGKRTFSVELASRQGLVAMTMAGSSDEGVFIEGTIGELVRITFLEGIIFEVTGREGTLRLDLGVDEMEHMLQSKAVEVKG